jgi:hypothetical protein
MRRLLFSLCILPFTCFSQTITTIVGTGTVGLSGDGGDAMSATLNTPLGLNFDNNGDLLICAQVHVRKVTLATNIISRIAGSDTSLGGPTGFGNGGHATCASVVKAYQIFVDEHDNYYIADSWSSQIRKVDATTGIITAYAGSSAGSTGDGGPATAARFNTIGCLLVDTVTDKLYVSDAFNYKVRVVDMTTGIITAFAGTGTSGYTGDGVAATSTRFSRVMGLCADRAGNIYIGDWDNARIRKVDIITGIVTTYAGSGITGYDGDGGPAISAKIAKPISMTMDTCDNMYFSDEDNQVVRRIDAGTGTITTIAGNGTVGFSGDGGLATAAQFNHPTGVKIDNAGNLYISDYFNCRVRKMTIIPPTPTVSITIAALPNDTVCAATAVTYSATVTGTGVPTYQWYKNGTVVSTIGSTYTYVPANGDSVRCVVTVNVCGSGSAWSSSNTINMEVTPLTAPTISLTSAPSTTAPIGSIVTVNATVGSTGSSYSIKWYKNSLLFATTSTPTTTYTKSAGTDIITARVSSTTATGCYDTTTSAAHTITGAVSVYEPISQHIEGLKLHPNPAHDVLNVTAMGQIDTVSINNSMGQSFSHIKITKDNNHAEIDVALLPVGVYVVRVNGIYFQRFVKQ